MKIEWKKFTTTDNFAKLFGVDKEKSSGTPPQTEEDDGYEYYYKRGNTYYFRNSEGRKISIAFNEPQQEFIRGNKYKIDRKED